MQIQTQPSNTLLAENLPATMLLGVAQQGSSTTVPTTAPTGPTVPSPSDAQWPVQSFTCLSSDYTLLFRPAYATDYKEAKLLMGMRYDPNWTPSYGSRIWVVQDLKDDCLVAITVLRPWDHGFLIDQFEVDRDQHGATWEGRKAAKMVEAFWHSFKKASGLKLYGIVPDNNPNQKKVVLKRGCKHVADVYELE